MNSDPWFTSINGMPGSPLDDLCPMGEGVVRRQPLAVRNLLHLKGASMAVLQFQVRLLPIHMEDGKGTK